MDGLSPALCPPASCPEPESSDVQGGKDSTFTMDILHTPQ